MTFDGSILNLLLNIGYVVFVIYVIAVAVYIISENRTPQSTFAWLLLLIGLPLVGLIIYYFLGRGSHAFSQETKLARQEMGSDLWQDVGPLITRQPEYVERIAKEKPASYHKKLLNLVSQNSSSMLSGYNEVEILQDATMKYPRLLEDIRAAQSSVHLNYYIWTEDKFTLQIKEALIDRAKAGLEVRCLYDQSGGMMSKQSLQDLTDGGVEIHPYLEYRSTGRTGSALPGRPGPGRSGLP